MSLSQTRSPKKLGYSADVQNGLDVIDALRESQ